MSGKKKVFQIEKIPLGFTPEIKLPDFPPIPRLYLELLENKAKVKSHLKHLEWEPKETTTFPLISSVKSKAESDVDVEIQELTKLIGTTEAGSYQAISPKFPSPPLPSIKEEYKQPIEQPVKTFSFVPPPQEDKDSDDIISSTTNSPRKPIKFFGINDSKPDIEEEPNTILFDEPEKVSFKEPVESMTDIELKMLEIENGGQDKPIEQTYKPTNFTTQSVNAPTVKDPVIAPSLKEVFNSEIPLSSSADPIKVKDLTYNGTSKELDEKRDLLFKFKILKRKYKEANVPDFPEYTDLATLKREYDTIVRQLRLDSTVEDYKGILTMAFFGLEFVIVNFMKWEDMRGFGADQMIKMNKYESVLVELGEKHYNSPIMQIGPELKLIGIVLIQAITFAATKMLMKGMGGNIMSNLASGALGGARTTPQQQSTPSPVETKGKMKPPPININDLLNKKNS